MMQLMHVSIIITGGPVVAVYYGLIPTKNTQAFRGCSMQMLL